MYYVIGLAVIIWMMGAAIDAIGEFFAQYGSTLLEIAAAAVALFTINRLVREIKAARYFASEEFAVLKKEIAAVVADHNELTGYVAEIREEGAISLGASSTGTQAHLASFENTSQWRCRRGQNIPEYSSSKVHNCSL